MIRLYILVEGETEERFVKNVLAPHLRGHHIDTYPVIVETRRDHLGRKHRGGGNWGKWSRDLQRLTGQQKGNDVRFTTLFDLYGLPAAFPGLKEHGAVANTRLRVERLEEALKASTGDWRFIPYLQRHEFEALVLAGLDALEALLDDQADREGVQKLRALVATTAPEDVDDGENTAPSKRLGALVSSYRKTLHGPLVVESTELAKLRERCTRFNEWIAKLEELSAGVK